ncbi:hypothetical protein GH714_029846 [Hevea brasiliensis]|uniref:TCP domain-containing protein n=1 Tax=Hevea brasiliensis TaxID=3981 RepID=A0A6A6NJX0_HEVBR|nr:hypothetical protein GH714_029846 [Hevea brasiliensis]
MRLSLKVAREFFDLQDKLRFDKASKTVEWLLIQARPAIKKLSSGVPQLNYSFSVGTKSASSTSECEVVSGIDDEAAAIKAATKISNVKTHHLHVSTIRGKRLTITIDESKPCEEAKNHELNQLTYCIPFETGEESGTQTHTMNPNPLEMLAREVKAPSSHEQARLVTTEGMTDDSLVIMGKWSPYASIINHLCNTAMPQEVSSKEVVVVFQLIE